MAGPARSAAFLPVKRLQGLEKFPEAERSLLEQLNAIRQDLARLQARPVFTELKTGDYQAREEEYVRAAPGTGGMTLRLPTPRVENRGARVTVLLENVTLASLVIQCVGGLVNGAATQTVALACRIDFVCDGVAGWRSEIGPGAVPLIDGDKGDVIVSGNGSVFAVDRTVDYQASPWTGPHQFNGEIRGGTLTSVSSTGAINVTLGAGSTRLLLSGTTTITLGTISGCADGRLLFIDKSGAGALVITHDSSSANAVSCPGDEDLTIKGRGGLVLVGRLGANANWKIVGLDNLIDPANTLPVTASRAIVWMNRTAFSAGAAGAADDVTVYSASAPFAFRIINVEVLIATAILATTVTLRDTSGGGGAVLSSALSSAATGTVRNNDTVTRTVASGGSVFLRRSDRGVAGEVIIYAVRT